MTNRVFNIGMAASLALAIVSVASIFSNLEPMHQEVEEKQKAGFCFPSYSDESKLVWRPCNNQYGSCEITYYGNTHLVPLFQLSSCGSCMAKNGFDADEIDTICMQHGIKSIRNATLITSEEKRGLK